MRIEGFEYLKKKIAELKEDCKNYRMETHRVAQIYKKNIDELKEQFLSYIEDNGTWHKNLEEILRDFQRIAEHSFDFKTFSAMSKVIKERLNGNK